MKAQKLKRVLGTILPAGTWHFYDFYRDVLSTIQITTMAQDFGFLLYTPYRTHGPDWAEFYQMTEKVVDGFLILAPLLDDPFLKAAAEKNSRPLMLLFSRSFRFSSICMDNEQGVFEAIDHLVKLGHKKIATITGQLESADGKERRDAYRKALKHHHLPSNEEWIAEGDFSRYSGRDAMLKLLGCAERPTALFAANDHMALGALEICQERKIRVPQDLAIIGCDDKPSSSLALQPLTTIRQPLEEIARQGTLMLINQIQSGSTERKDISIPGKLIVRETCGAKE